MAKTLLLVGGWASFRDALAEALRRHPDIDPHTAARPQELARPALRCDLAAVLQERSDDFAALAELRRLRPACAIVLLSPSLDPLDYSRALALDALGVLDLHLPLDQLLRCLRCALEEKALRAPEEVVELLREGGRRQARLKELRARVDRLTEREREVLQTIAEGLTAEEAARRLFISPHTQRTHVGNILTKLGARTQLQAVLFAHAMGVVAIREPLAADAREPTAVP